MKYVVSLAIFWMVKILFGSLDMMLATVKVIAYAYRGVCARLIQTIGNRLSWTNKTIKLSGFIDQNVVRDACKLEKRMVEWSYNLNDKES